MTAGPATELDRERAAGLHVYRSAHPELLRALTRHQAEQSAFPARCQRWAEAHPIRGVVRTPCIEDISPCGSTVVVGLTPVDGDDLSYPRKVADAPYSGWKYTRKHSLWVPDTRSDAGREIQLELRSLTLESVAAVAARIAAMPLEIPLPFDPRTGLTPTAGARITVHDGVVTAETPADARAGLTTEDDRAWFKQFWFDVRLSDFYAERGL